MVNEYADICGWSEKELLDNFRPGIETLAEEREEDFEDTLKELWGYYDGYLFALKGSRLYNPYSVFKSTAASTSRSKSSEPDRHRQSEGFFVLQ